MMKKTMTTQYTRLAAGAILMLAGAAMAPQQAARAQNDATTTTVTTAPSGDSAGTTVTVTVNSQPVTFPEGGRPRMFGGRVMVPLRGVIEKLGGTVLYDAATQVITGANPATNSQFRLHVGSTDALANGQTVSLATPPVVVDGTTYVPLRFVSEALGAHVAWDEDHHAVTIMAAGSRATVSADRNAPAATAPAAVTTTTTTGS